MSLMTRHPDEPLANFHQRMRIHTSSAFPHRITPGATGGLSASSNSGDIRTGSKLPAAPTRDFEISAGDRPNRRWNVLRRQGRLLCPTLFALQWMLIGCVSAFDTYLLAKYRLEIMILERNPMGLLLLRLDEGEPALFIGLKFLGTVCVLGVVGGVYAYSRGLGHCVAGALAAFQLGLLAYLIFA